MGAEWIPSLLRRGRSWAVGAPRALMLLIGDVSGAFDPGEGGDWVWYPYAGTHRPHPLARAWSVRGPGGAMVGSLTCADGRARFNPSPYWRAAGNSDWEVAVVQEDRAGAWVRLHTGHGTLVLRRR